MLHACSIQWNFKVTIEELVKLLINALIEFCPVLSIDVKHYFSFLLSEIGVDKFYMIMNVMVGTYDTEVVVVILQLKFIKFKILHIF
jgi:hypothetical protein